MVELFFIKRFIIEKFIPYSILFISIGYIIFELACPNHIREHFYLYSDKLYFKFIIRPFQQINKSFIKSKSKLKLKLKSKILKSREKRNLKEKMKKEKELKANERSKLKLNKKIDKVNKKIKKQEKKVNKKKARVRFVAFIIRKLFKLNKNMAK